MKEFFRFKNIKKSPSSKQWRQFFSILTKKEGVAFSVLVCLVLASLLFLGLNFYFTHTVLSPALGGHFKEGTMGQPRFINPLYLSTQDVDRDIVELLFSGLMKYNEKGELIKDLAKEAEIKEQGKAFEFSLKDNIFWHDGTPLTVKDIVFTIQLIQNPEYQSPLRIKWAGIIVEKISDSKVLFKLPKKYSGFLETLTVKILPKHIFENIPPKNLPWSLVSQDYLIGSGPFKFKTLVQDNSGFVKKLTLERNENYYGKEPFLNELSFLFFQEEKGLLKAANLGEIDGFSLSDPKAGKHNFKARIISLPRYFALFFNFKTKGILTEKALREALAKAINKQEIIEKVFSGKAQVVDSPILPQFFDFEAPATVYNFSPTSSEEILEEQGFKLNPETQKRERHIVKKAAFTFEKNLTYGNQNKDVEELQKCLRQDPAVYPEGVVSGYFGSKTRTAVIKFQEKYVKDILEPIGLKKGTGDVKPMTREKLNEICFEKPTEITPLQLTLTTCDKFPLNEIAEVVKKNWEEIGIEVEIRKVSLSELQTNILAKRNFEILLFGEALASIPDPFPFWHSTQKEYPGLNIATYKSKDADKLLEKAREAEKEEERKENLEKFQDVLTEDLPAIFLARPDYVYALSPKIKGYNVEKITEPAKRFNNVEQWYAETKRVWQ